MLILSSAHSQDISISANVDRTEIELGGSFELSISLSGPVRSIPKPTLPDLSDFDVYSSGTSSNISIIPGAISYQTEHSYTLVPRRVGTFIIQPAKVRIKGKEYSTQPIQVKVVPPSQKKQAVPPRSGSRIPSSRQPGQASDFFIEQVVDIKKPYVGQQVTLIFRFYRSRNLFEQPTVSWPDYKGFWVEDLPPQKSYNEYIGGRAYMVTEIRRALFPTVSGRLEIEPTVLTIPPDAFGGLFSHDPFNFFSRRKRSTFSEKVLRTDKIVLDVKPLPGKNKPANFSGAVGAFKFRIALDKDTVEVDQPITLKAVLSGTGNIKKLPGIEIPPLENFRLYDSGSNENISKKNYKVSGSKSFEWVLIPITPGKYDIPELSFSYFDPWSRKYKTLARKPASIYIKPSSAASLSPADRPVNVIPAARTSLNYILTDLSTDVQRQPLYKNRLAWVIQVLPIIWLVYLSVYVNRRKKLEGDIAYARRKRATKAARKALQKTKMATPEEFFSHIYNGLIGFVSDKLNLNASGLTKMQIIELLKKAGKCDAILDDFSEFLSQCDAGRFSPGKPTDDQMKEIYAKAERLLSELDRRLK